MSLTLEEKLKALQTDPLEQKLSAMQEQAGTSVGVAADSAGEQFLNNIMAIPSASGDLLAGASALVQRPFSDSTLGELYDEEKGKFPASALRAIPRPTVRGMGAAVRSVPSLFPGGESPSEAFSRNRSEIDRETELFRAGHPFAEGVGETLGDAATIAAGRLPFARGITRAEGKLMNRAPMQFDSDNLSLGQESIKALDKLFKSAPISRLLRGTGRAAEVGAEAAVLDALQGDSPFETAGLAIGAQLGSSLVLSAADAPSDIMGVKSKRGRFLLNAGALTAGLIVLDNLTDIGPDSAVGSIDQAFDKITLLMAAGIAVSPFGRARSDDMPKLADMVSSIPRGAIISLLERVKDKPEEQAQLRGVIDRLPSMSPAEQEAFMSTLESGDLMEKLDQFSFDKPPSLDANPR